MTGPWEVSRAQAFGLYQGLAAASQADFTGIIRMVLAGISDPGLVGQVRNEATLRMNDLIVERYADCLDGSAA